MSLELTAVWSSHIPSLTGALYWTGMDWSEHNHRQLASLSRVHEIQCLWLLIQCDTYSKSSIPSTLQLVCRTLFWGSWPDPSDEVPVNVHKGDPPLQCTTNSGDAGRGFITSDPADRQAVTSSCKRDIKGLQSLNFRFRIARASGGCSEVVEKMPNMAIPLTSTRALCALIFNSIVLTTSACFSHLPVPCSL